MPTTPGGIVYPSATDSPDIPADLQALSESVQAIFDALGDWADYTPALTAGTTNPNLGTAPTQVGRYCRVGNTVYGQGRIAFGGTGVSSGSGAYRIGLPPGVNIKSLSNTIPVGRGWLTDDSANVVAAVDLCAGGDNVGYLFGRYPGSWPTGSLVNLAASFPWTWAVNDSLAFAYVIECYP